MSERFVEKYGGKSFPLQLDDLDDQLRNRLWNCFTRHFYDQHTKLKSFSAFGGKPSGVEAVAITSSALEEVALRRVILDSVDPLGVCIDNIPLEMDRRRSHGAYAFLKKKYIAFEWAQVYEFFDQLFIHMPKPWKGEFQKKVNVVLEQENSGYRVVSGRVTPITDSFERSEVEEALARMSQASREHLDSALAMLGKNPKSEENYRAAAKEAISAVESVVREKTGEKSLGTALKKIKKGSVANPTFIQAMEKLYGYTNSPDSGIRHSLLGEFTSIDFSDAKYFVVVCAAFVNFIYSKEALEQ